MLRQDQVTIGQKVTSNDLSSDFGPQTVGIVNTYAFTSHFKHRLGVMVEFKKLSGGSDYRFHPLENLTPAVPAIA